jgi:hypothetical protein
MKLCPVLEPKTLLNLSVEALSFGSAGADWSQDAIDKAVPRVNYDLGGKMPCSAIMKFIVR